jgi:hypothetical protein
MNLFSTGSQLVPGEIILYGLINEKTFRDRDSGSIFL